MKTRFTLLLILLFTLHAFAQDKTISGIVTSAEDNMPVPGVNVIVQGTIRGVSTDFDGGYSINVNKGEILEFSSLGFKTVEIQIQDQTTVNISLEPDIASLDEVVVIGYGTQKKRDLTGAIASVDAESIEKTPTANVMQSLQGKLPGVQIVSAGAPGESPTVRIRGLGSFNSGDTKVLYVVDGAFYDNIDFLNTKDIKSVNVLKDASSSAIFGVRAANGVVIIETKSGRLNSKPQIEYDGYTGIQHAQNVVKMANSEQFVTWVNESGSTADISFIDNAMQRYGRSRVNPNVPNVNTDWYDEILRNGIIQNHSISGTGGGENVSYAMGLNYFSQEGILDMKNEYERFNIRSKVDANLTDRIKVGVNSVFSNATQYKPENGAWFKAYFAVPIIPVIDEMNTDASPVRYSNAQLLGYRGTQNPFSDLTYFNNRFKIRKILANVYTEIDFIKNKLKFRTSYSHNFSALEERRVIQPYSLGNNVDRISEIKRENNTFSNQYWDNTLTFKDTFGDHDLTLLAGHSYRDEANNKFNATGQDIRGISLESSQFLDFADPESFNNKVEEIGKRFYGLSYFGRVAYSFKNRYLAYGTIRHEISSKFTKDNSDTFLGLGLGWVLTEENFMKDNGVFDFFKIRGSWGQLGNDNVDASSGANTIDVVFTDFGDQQFTGFTSTSVFNDLVWEFVEELNFGINATTFNNRLSIDADYFIRDTKRAIFPITIPVVDVTLNQNAGTIQNRGLELSLNWSDKISDDFSYTIGANFNTIKNEVTRIDNEQGYIDTGSAEFRQRTILGNPVQTFFGLERVGVYQNQAQVDADPFAANHPEANLQPGDLIYKDQNGDGFINGDDRVILGSFLPKFAYGGNIGMSYKNFDFSLSFYGQGGNKILNRKRGEIIFTNDTNIDADLAVNRWHGEGTSNSYPSSEGIRKSWNQQLSEFWIEDGDFFRIQNIQLAYNISGKSLGTNMPDARIYLTAERPFTTFKYNGFTPEVNNGVDRQTYPIPAIYTLGINLKI
ncbi:SusC/RagA family TonB-linked outer membrane protein [Flavivirga rizhaonensis]|uniref:TonB-dependent receptor n=1 Tax=Flavivirga rizhaonensis TaxID=2559571 RepID=A0A4S1DW97_9FLAO|nr:TonB-dependent receptor [Flavivirga rizhaonensis]TGV02165.1 TonB-dependent receptor [Flavivirga rizhaonensis]